MTHIGIDPDCKKSGYANYSKDGLVLHCFTLPELLNEIKTDCKYAAESKEHLKIYIEAGWLNKSNWHVSFYAVNASVSTGAKKGQKKAANPIAAVAETARRTGENHQRGKDIHEMCEAIAKEYGDGFVSVALIRPTAQKKNDAQFKALTKYKGVTNQEKRDAGMLVFGRKI